MDTKLTITLTLPELAKLPDSADIKLIHHLKGELIQAVQQAVLREHELATHKGEIAEPVLDGFTLDTLQAGSLLATRVDEHALDDFYEVTDVLPACTERLTPNNGDSPNEPN